MSARHPSRDGERGAALATVLIMVAIMSMLALVSVDAANVSVRRSTNQEEIEQARWYLIGAERFAAGKIAELTQYETATAPPDEWIARPFVFPLDDGAMSVTLHDGSNCFNLNALSSRSADGDLEGSAAGQVQFARLLDLLDVRGASGASLVAALSDWIDNDSHEGPGGAEDGAYGGEAYKTGNTLLADMSELARVRGFDAEVRTRLARHACVRPNADANRINPNTLTPDQAELLSMVIGPDLPASVARDLIRNRPRSGWADMEDFFADPRLAGLELNEPTRAAFDLSSRYYVAVIGVQYRGARESSASLIEVSGGRARVVRRVFGAGTWEHAV